MAVTIAKQQLSKGRNTETMALKISCTGADNAVVSVSHALEFVPTWARLFEGSHSGVYVGTVPRAFLTFTGDAAAGTFALNANTTTIGIRVLGALMVPNEGHWILEVGRTHSTSK